MRVYMRCACVMQGVGVGVRVYVRARVCVCTYVHIWHYVDGGGNVLLCGVCGISL